MNAYNRVEGPAKRSRGVGDGINSGVELGSGVVVEVCDGGGEVPACRRKSVDSELPETTRVPMRLKKASSPMPRYIRSMKGELVFLIASLLFSG
jgi:hypothetical protein